MKDWTAESVSYALYCAVERGDIKSWSKGYTGHGDEGSHYALRAG